MRDMMEYKGYLGSVHYSAEDQVFYGKVESIRSLISYEGTDVQGLTEAFHEAVHDYLELCREQGMEPEAPFNGSFRVRTGSDLHRRLAILASRQGKTLNQVVSEALERYLSVA